MLFRGTKHGFRAETFHQLCDDQGATLSIIKPDVGRVFGLFTDIPWQTVKGLDCKAQANTFRFSFIDGQLVKFPSILGNTEIHCHENHLVSGVFFTIFDRCDENSKNIAKGRHPQEPVYKSVDLADVPHFKVKEIEVYRITQELVSKDVISLIRKFNDFSIGDH